LVAASGRNLEELRVIVFAQWVGGPSLGLPCPESAMAYDIGRTPKTLACLVGIKTQIMPGSGYPNNAFDRLRIFSLSIVDEITLR
jgi:hypothetical protein